MSVIITREQLRDAGVHFGHQTKRWHPKMKPYIYGEKNKYHIIDIDKTLIKLQKVKEIVSRVGAKGEKIIFVGTRKNAKPAVKEAAERTNNFYVNNRWLGGTLTNMKTIQIRIKRLFDIENEEKTEKLNLRAKKERLLILKEKDKLEVNLGGIKKMHKLPALMFVADPKLDEIAVKEARKLRIIVIGICDTNVDPDIVDIAIPANDDLPESVNILINYIVDVYAEAANIKLSPSTLKVIAQKKEDNPRPQRGPRDENNFYKPRYTDNVEKKEGSILSKDKEVELKKEEKVVNEG
ncbi:30S ribosomal protein S2 [Spiroplasma endosymbiont of Aspidapion aeneum]|uniref:30S ribosomal protein S2 n=1 Tax=Spiroplasma endosymbiont of Aspidapion aeneum TaxID=3066276 RepID=UPI003CC7AEDE